VTDQIVKKIILEPSLDRCVETIARRRYWDLVDEYSRTILTKGILRDVEMKIEALRLFLEDLNIHEYRRKTEDLMGKGKKVFLVLELTREGLNVVIEHHESMTVS